MKQNRFVLAMLGASLALGACKKAAPVAPAPMPTQPQVVSSTDDDAARRAAAEREARERAEREARERARATLMELVHFDYDRFDIRADSRASLEAKVPVLRQNNAVRLRIEGHADERGSDEYNLALGMRRATAVKDFLAGFGLDAARFETVSFGEERPLERASTEAAWARNRRAEFQILSGL